MIANPPRPPEPNKWRLQEQTLRGPDATARGHNADAFDEARVEEQLLAEEDLGVELRTFDGRTPDERERRLMRDPVRYQIARLKELQRQRALGSLKPAGVEGGYGVGQMRSGAHATRAQPELVIANARFFHPLSLRRRLEWVRGARDRTGEAPGREFSEVGGDVREFDGASDGHLVQKQFQALDHVRYPRTSSHFAIWPGSPQLRLSEVVAERARMGAQDAALLFAYAPNVTNYGRYVMTMDGEEEPEEVGGGA